MDIQKFSPAKAEIQSAVEEVKNLTINGIDDVAGYEAVKLGKKRLAEYRIDITKFGKKQREEALAYQREVLRQEKELLEMIEPTELRLKGELEAIDEEKKRQERIVLLPTRIKMLEEIGIKLLDAEILRMDEKEFSEYYNTEKLAYLERKAQVEREEREKKEREAEIERLKQEAVEKAKKEAEEKAELEKKELAEKAEKEKQEAIDKIKREQEEKDRKAKEEADRIKQAEEERMKKEKEDKEKAEKNKKYQDWLKKHGYNEQTKDKFYIKREGNTFTIYIKTGEITI